MTEAALPSKARIEKISREWDPHGGRGWAASTRGYMAELFSYVQELEAALETLRGAYDVSYREGSLYLDQRNSLARALTEALTWVNPTTRTQHQENWNEVMKRLTAVLTEGTAPGTNP